MDFMIEAFHLWFVVVYILGFIFFVALILKFRARGQTVEKRQGLLPPPPSLISWLVPPVVLLTEVGQISAVWMPVRVVGVALSLYAVIMLPWSSRVLGRSYAPGAAVLQDHSVVTSGPFQLVRHPIYSAVAALWLGAGLGALNWILLLVWPLVVVVVTKSARAEESMLLDKFGDAYEQYAGDKGRLVPKLWGKASD